MDHLTLTILLLVAAVAIFVAELFIPSGGLLTLLGVVVLVFFNVQMFAYGPTAGLISLTASVTALPLGAYFVLRNLERLPFGRFMVPPNPAPSQASPLEANPALAALVGRRGRAISPLRPVGTCEFDGRRVQCITEGGMIDAGSEVEAIGVSVNNLTVRSVRPSSPS